MKSKSYIEEGVFSNSTGTPIYATPLLNILCIQFGYIPQLNELLLENGFRLYYMKIKITFHKPLITLCTGNIGSENDEALKGEKFIEFENLEVTDITFEQLKQLT